MSIREVKGLSHPILEVSQQMQSEMPCLSISALEGPFEKDFNEQELIQSYSILCQDPIEILPPTSSSEANAKAYAPTKRKNSDAALDEESSDQQTEDNLRLFAHVFLDKDLRGSSLESFSFLEIIPLLLPIIDQVPKDELTIEPLNGALQELYNISKELCNDIEMSFDEVYSLIQQDLKGLLDNIDLSEESKAFLSDIIRSDRLKTPLRDFGSTDTISSHKFNKTEKNYAFFLDETLKDIFTTPITFTTDIKRSPHEVLSSQTQNSAVTHAEAKKAHDSLSRLLKKVTFSSVRDAYYQRCKAKNAHILHVIQSRILNLLPSEKIYLPSGFYDEPSSHAMIITIEKSEDETFCLSIINTGAGTQNHPSTETIVSPLSEDVEYLKDPSSHTIIAFAERRIEPVVCFKKIPKVILFPSKDAPSLFLQTIIDLQTIPFYTYIKSINPRFSPEEAIYEIIFSYLGPYYSFQTVDPSSHFLIYPQRSGTCVWNSIRTLFRLHFGSVEKYKTFSHHFKTLLIQKEYDAVRHLASDSSIEKLEKHVMILHRGSQNFLSSLYQDIKHASSARAQEKVAIATAADLHTKMSTILSSIETIKGAARKKKYKLHFTEYKINQAEIQDLKEIVQNNFLVSNDITPSTEALDLPNHTIYPLHSCVSIENFDKELLCVLTYVNKHNPPLAWVEEYIDSIPFPSNWQEAVSNPTEALKVLCQIIKTTQKKYHSQQQNSYELIFLRKWKMFLIAKALVEQINPEHISQYPIDSFFFVPHQMPPAHFLIKDATTHDYLCKCMQEVKIHNENAPSNMTPLFYFMHKVNISYSSIPSLMEADATVNLYLTLIKELPPLRDALVQNAVKKDKRSEEEISDIYLTKYLYEDFDLERGPLATYGLGHITLLKTIAFYTFCELISRSNHETLKLITEFESNEDAEELNFYIENINGPEDSCESFMFSSYPSYLSEEVSSAILTMATQSIPEENIEWNLSETANTEMLLLQNNEIFEKIFPSLSSIERRLLIDLFIIPLSDEKKFQRLFSLFSRKENEKSLNKDLFLELFKTILFGANSSLSTTHQIIHSMKESESLRLLATDFFHEELDRYTSGQVTNSSRINTILEAALNIKESLYPVPFLPEWKECLLKHHSNLGPTFLSSCLDLTLIEYERHDKTGDTAENIGKLLHEVISLSLKTDSLSQSQEYKLSRILLQNRYILSAEGFFFPLKEDLIKVCGKNRAIDTQISNISFSPNSPVVYLHYNHTCKLAIDLLSHKIYFINGNGWDVYFQDNEIENKISHPILTALLEQYTDHVFQESTNLIHMKTKAGVFSWPKSFNDPDITCPMSFCPNHDWKGALPSELIDEHWNHISSYYIENIEHEYDHPIQAINGNTFLTSYEMRLLRFLPFEEQSIHQLFAYQYKDDLFVMTTNKDFVPIHLLRLCQYDASITLHDLLTDKKHAPLSENHWIRLSLPSISMLKELSSSPENIKAYDSTNRTIELSSSNGKLCLRSDPKYQHSNRKSPQFYFLNKGVWFTNIDNGSSHKILLSATTHTENVRIYKKDNDPILSLKQLFIYEIEEGKVIPQSAADEIYLCFLKIVNQCPDRLNAIEKMKELTSSIQTQKHLQELAKEIITQLSKCFDTSGIAKDDLCLYILTLSISLSAKNLKKLPGPLILSLSKIYDYYISHCSVPECYLLTNEMETTLLNIFASKKLTASKATKASKHLSIICSMEPYAKIDKIHDNKTGFPSIRRWLQEEENSKISVGVSTQTYRDIREIYLMPALEFIKLLDAQKERRFELLFKLLMHTFFEKTSSQNVLIKLALCINPSLIHDLNLQEIKCPLTLKKKLSYPNFLLPLNYALSTWKYHQDSHIFLEGVKDYTNRPKTQAFRCNEVERSLLYTKKLKSDLHIMEERLLAHGLHFTLFNQVISAVQQVSHRIFSAIEIPNAKPHSFTTSPLKEECLAASEMLLLQSQGAQCSLDTALTNKDIIPYNASDNASSFRIFMNTLDSIIDKREKILLAKAPMMYTSSAKDIDPWKIISLHGSSYQPHLTFEMMLYSFLEASPMKYEHTLGFAEHGFTTESTADRKVLQATHDEVGTLLILKIWRRKLKSLQAKLDKGPLKEHRDIISQDPGLSMNYTKQTIDQLIFEYLTGMDIRLEQKSLLKEFEKSTHSVGQLTMGGGKSSVILPLLIRQAVDKGKIPIVVCMKAQVIVMSAALQKALPPLFHQKVIPLEISRSTLSHEYLIKIKRQLYQSLDKKYVFVCSAETIQAIELEYVNALYNQDVDYATINTLREILCLLSKSGCCIVDEFAHVADVTKITNYPVSSAFSKPKRLTLDEIIYFKEIFLILCGHNGLSSKELISNQQMYLTQEQIIQIQKMLIEYMKNQLMLTFPDTLDENFYQTFYNRAKIGEDIAQVLRQNVDKHHCSRLCLSHLFIHQLLPKICHQCGGRNYGRSIDPTKVGKVIPYQGVGSPATTEFALPYEALSYHFLYAAQFGISIEQIEAIGKSLHQEAELACQRLHIPFEQTKQSMVFTSLTGISLKKHKAKDQLQLAFEKLENERKKGQFDNIFEMETLTAQQNITFYPEYLSSSPHDLFAQFSEVKGLTGTPWNHPIYSACFQGNLYMDCSIEQKIETAFIAKSCVKGIDHFAFVTEESSPDLLLENVLNQVEVEERGKICAIVDTGGLFKKHSNAEVACALMKTLSTALGHHETISLIYFDRKTARDMPDEPFLLRWKKNSSTNDKISLPDLKASTLKEHSVFGSPYFVYYDERHTIGTDIPLPPKGICLITVDKQTPLYQFSQGLLRARGYFLEQQAITVIPQKMAHLLPELTLSPQNFLEHLKQNEKRLLSSLSFKSFEQQIETACKQYILKICQNEEEINYTMINHFSSLLIKTEGCDHINLIYQEEARDLSIELIQEKADKLLAKFQELHIPESNLEDLKKSLRNIILQAKSCIYLGSSFNDYRIPHQVHMETQVEIQVEQQKQIQHEQQNEIQTILSDKDLYLSEEVIVYFNKVIDHFKKSSFTHIDQQTSLRISPISFREASSAEDGRFCQAFSTLYLSTNVLSINETDVNGVLHLYKKKINSLLVILKNDKRLNPVVIGLSEAETEDAQDYLIKHPEDHAFILNEKGITLVDNKRNAQLYQYKDIIENARIEMMVFNMNLEDLSNLSLASHLWLNDHPNDNSERAFLRKELVARICHINEKSHLLPIVQSLISMEIRQEIDEMQQRAQEQIRKSLTYLEMSQIEDAKSIIEQFPTSLLHLVPEKLCPLLPKRHLAHLCLESQVRSLSDKDLRYLQQGQLGMLPPERVRGLMACSPDTSHGVLERILSITPQPIARFDDEEIFANILDE